MNAILGLQRHQHHFDQPDNVEHDWHDAEYLIDLFAFFVPLNHGHDYLVHALDPARTQHMAAPLRCIRNVIALCAGMGLGTFAIRRTPPAHTFHERFDPAVRVKNDHMEELHEFAPGPTVLCPVCPFPRT